MITSSQGKSWGGDQGRLLKEVVFQLHREVWKGFEWAMKGGETPHLNREEQFGKMVWEGGAEHSADEWRPNICPAQGSRQKTALTTVVTEHSRAPAAGMRPLPPPPARSSVTPFAEDDEGQISGKTRHEERDRAQESGPTSRLSTPPSEPL